MTTNVQEKKGLNRDVIKCVAMLTMFVNHFAHTFVEPQTLLYEILLDIGYFTAITMCYFMVEGFYYTRSRKKYALRLLVFALITQVPYEMLFGMGMLNMMFSLLNCFLILCIMEKWEGKWYKVPVIVLLFIPSFIMDWGPMAPMFTLMFLWARGDRKKVAISYGINILAYFIMNFLNYILHYPVGEAALYTLGSVLGLVVSGIVILYFYNGKKATVAPKFFKWFFYLFYPGHIVALLVAAKVLGVM